MRILFLNYEFPPIGGGASPVSLEIARGYARCGHTVDVVTMSYRDLPEFEVVDNINIFRVKSLRSKKEICHPWEQLTYLISARKFLSKRLTTHKYDINHTHFIIPTGVLALWAKKFFNLPYIITSHGSDVLGYNKRFSFLYPFLERPWKNIVSNAKCVTAPSDFLIKEINSITRDGTFRTIANGLDLLRFRPMTKDNKILIVARLFQNKGVQEILEALKGLDLSGWKVDIVGDGPYREFLENMAVSYGLNNLARFHGWMDNDSAGMKELYGKAKIFISASHFESFGLTVLEAISAGCYPLVSDIGGHRYILNDDRYFFKLNDVADLRRKLSNLIQNMPETFSIDINRFNWDTVIKDYTSLLEN